MYLIVKDKGVMKDLGIINKIRSFFKTPNKVSIRKGFNNWFKFYNSNLANNETIFSDGHELCSLQRPCGKSGFKGARGYIMLGKPSDKFHGS